MNNNNDNKSIAAFVLGLIGSILGGLSSLLGLPSILMFLFFQISGLASIAPIILMILYIITFVGAIVCIFNKKIGGFIILIPTVISFFLFFNLIFQLLKNIELLKLWIFFVPWIPMLFNIIASVLALKKPRRKVPDMDYII